MKSRSYRAERTQAPGARRQALSRWPFAIAILILIAAVFGQLSHADFLSYDDDFFVTANQHVQSFDVAWAWTSADLGYYPLTWMSHMLDVRLFGLNPGAMHVVNILLHAVTSILLLLALVRLTGAVVPSAIVAAIFAIHPLRVESVAWIAERKDTLSALFGIAALYVYAKRPRHWLVAVFMAASLLSKQTMVTLPVLLMIVDWWRDGRWSLVAGRWCKVGDRQGATTDQRPATSDLLIDKLPLFALSILGAVAAIIGQRNLGAVQTLQAQPLTTRVANAVVACVTYLAKIFIPTQLAVIYPMKTHATSIVLACALVLIAITVAACMLRERMPYLLAGWLWFVIALVPLIGFVQIGRQSMADRYTYIPSIGIVAAVVFFAAERLSDEALAIGGTVAAVALAVLAQHQAGYWRDTPTLFKHSVAVTGPNLWADYILGQSLQQTDPDAALPALDRALTAAEKQHEPKVLIEAHVAAGVAFLTKASREPQVAQRLRLIELGERECREALKLAPDDKRAANNFAVAEQFRAQTLSTSSRPR